MWKGIICWISKSTHFIFHFTCDNVTAELHSLFLWKRDLATDMPNGRKYNSIVQLLSVSSGVQYSGLTAEGQGGWGRSSCCIQFCLAKYQHISSKAAHILKKKSTSETFSVVLKSSFLFFWATKELLYDFASSIFSLIFNLWRAKDWLSRKRLNN